MTDSTESQERANRRPVKAVLNRLRSFGAAVDQEVESHHDHWAARVFLMVAIPVGVLFVFLIPPTQVIDEESHFLRSWQLSELNLVTDVRFDPDSGLDRNGGVFDLCVVDYIRGIRGVAATPQDFSFRSFWLDTPDCSPRQREFVITDAGTGYGPWSYPGQVIGLSVARVLGLPLPVTFYVGRLAGLAVFVALVSAALRIAPSARLTMMFVALLPASMISAVAYNTDGVMIGGSILASACALRLALSDVLHPRRLLLVMTVALAAVAATKPPYAVLLGLLLVIPAERFGSRKVGRRLLVASAAVVTLFAVVWYRVGRGADSTPIFYAGTDPGHQLRTVVRHPVQFLNTVWDSVLSYTYEVFFLRGWTGVFGMLRSGRPEIAPLLPVVYVVLAAGALGATVVVEAGRRRELSRRTRTWRQLVSYGVLIGGPLAVFFSAFLFWTQPGAAVIDSVQGRYMLPFLPLAAVAPALVRERSTARLSVRGVAIVSLVILLASLRQMVALFY